MTTRTEAGIDAKALTGVGKHEAIDAKTPTGVGKHKAIDARTLTGVGKHEVIDAGLRRALESTKQLMQGL